MVHNSIFVMVDVINDIVHPEGKLSCFSNKSEFSVFLNNMDKVIGKMKEMNIKIIQSKVQFSDSYIEMPLCSPLLNPIKSTGALVRGTWGTKTVDGLNIADDVKEFEKNAIDPFSSTLFKEYILSNNIKHIYLTGVSSRWAIESCVRSAHDLDIMITVISDCCAASSSMEHENALDNCRMLADVITLQDL
ncbi:cysteine hydrolase [Photobacterium marinum]|uniref:cysteine hydrolase n=1 Tax=Photobacterium marinum TaxID=1056511 RepID=UPI000561120B|nr:cysteine hydrolase [Photobacterium marinum]